MNTEERGVEDTESREEGREEAREYIPSAPYDGVVGMKAVVGSGSGVTAGTIGLNAVGCRLEAEERCVD